MRLHSIVHFMPKNCKPVQQSEDDISFGAFTNPSICAAHTPSNFLKGKVSRCAFRPSCASMFWARQGVRSGNWLQVFHCADATRLGSDRRQPHQTRAVREEKCVGLEPA